MVRADVNANIAAGWSQSYSGNVLVVLLLSALLTLENAPDDAPSGPLGIWLAGGARLELKEEGGKVVGRLASGGGPCQVPLGTELLRGSILDDSLTAEVRLCLIEPKCGSGPDTALAVLLVVTRMLTGGVHSKQPCAIEAKSLVLRRPGPALAMTAPLPAERLSHTAPPKAPRRVVLAASEIAPAQKLPKAQAASATTLNRAGEIPGHPAFAEQAVGDQPRDARQAGAPRSAVDKLMRAGLGYLHHGRFERARKAFRDALAIEPTRVDAYSGVGVTYWAQGDLDEALAWYKRALEADPRFGDAYYNIACTYSLQGHKALALRYLRLAALNHYSERDRLEKDPDLANLRGEPEMAEILDQMGADAKPSSAPGAR